MLFTGTLYCTAKMKCHSMTVLWTIHYSLINSLFHQHRGCVSCTNQPHSKWKEISEVRMILKNMYTPKSPGSVTRLFHYSSKIQPRENRFPYFDSPNVPTWSGCGFPGRIMYHVLVIRKWRIITFVRVLNRFLIGSFERWSDLTVKNSRYTWS